jgi:hypothetical protein
VDSLADRPVGDESVRRSVDHDLVAVDLGVVSRHIVPRGLAASSVSIMSAALPSALWTIGLSAPAAARPERSKTASGTAARATQPETKNATSASGCCRPHNGWHGFSSCALEQ